MNLPREIIEAARLLSEEPASRQRAANLIKQLEAFGLSVHLSLSVGPQEKITPDLADLIKTHRDALIVEKTAPLAELSDSRRYFAEKQRALDMRRQKKAFCSLCLYFNLNKDYKDKGYCRSRADVYEVKKLMDYCGEFMPLDP